MQLYNTLTRKKEELTPINPPAVNVYSCGPTVYDHIHIGNLSSFIYADTLVRTLREAGYQVKHVMNFTDVDDKTIRRSHEEYPDLEPTEALQKLTEKYSKQFLDDMSLIGVDVKNINFVKATDHIKHMQDLISKLYKDGFAYVAEDGIYFSIERYRASGKKYGQLLTINEGNTSEARINNDEYDKENVHDFALWKKQKPGEPSWEFELDDHDITGRPGWHIECSAMSKAELGQPFDIHTGGIDLIFPHHENEIAQSTAGNSDPVLAKLFFHNEHMLVDSKKMSKSLNNFYTIDDIGKKGFDPLAFRLMVLQSNYRNQSDFSWENLEAAQNRLNELRAWADLKHQPSTDVMPTELDELFGTTRESMKRAILDDLNTPLALAEHNKLVAYMSDIAIPGVEGKYTDGTLGFIDNLLGLQLGNRPDITPDQKELIKQREKAREDKNWEESDRIRDELKEQGIGLKDTQHGSVWYRI